MTSLSRALLVSASLSCLVACGAPADNGFLAVSGDDAAATDDASGDDAAAGDSAPLQDATPAKDSAPPPADASPPPPSSGISILVEPNGNDGNELVNAIYAARKSVHMTMYILSSSTVIQALVARHKAGVDVKVVLNQNFASGTGDNSSVYSQLQAAGVPVTWASSAYTYTHEKCVILDGTTAWIMTMNASTTSPKYNREYLAIDTVAADVAEAEQIFAADYAHTSISPSGPLVVAPVNARPSLVSLINGATHTLDVEGEEFSDSTIAKAIAQAAQRGVRVHVVLANDTSNTSSNAAVVTVKSAGASVVVSGGTSGSSTSADPYIHAKTIVVDGARAYVGSENFSTGSLLYNRELGVIFANAGEIAKITSAIDSDYAAGTPL